MAKRKPGSDKTSGKKKTGTRKSEQQACFKVSIKKAAAAKKAAPRKFSLYPGPDAPPLPPLPPTDKKGGRGKGRTDD